MKEEKILSHWLDQRRSLQEVQFCICVLKQLAGSAAVSASIHSLRNVILYTYNLSFHQSTPTVLLPTERRWFCWWRNQNRHSLIESEIICLLFRCTSFCVVVKGDLDGVGRLSVVLGLRLLPCIVTGTGRYPTICIDGYLLLRGAIVVVQIQR